MPIRFELNSTTTISPNLQPKIHFSLSHLSKSSTTRLFLSLRINSQKVSLSHRLLLNFISRFLSDFFQQDLKSFFYILSSDSRSFDKQQRLFLSKILSLISLNLANLRVFLNQINLIPNKHNNNIRISLVFQFFDPLFGV